MAMRIKFNKSVDGVSTLEVTWTDNDIVRAPKAAVDNLCRGLDLLASVALVFNHGKHNLYDDIWKNVDSLATDVSKIIGRPAARLLNPDDAPALPVPEVNRDFWVEDPEPILGAGFVKSLGFRDIKDEEKL